MWQAGVGHPQFKKKTKQVFECQLPEEKEEEEEEEEEVLPNHFNTPTNLKEVSQILHSSSCKIQICCCDDTFFFLLSLQGPTVPHKAPPVLTAPPLSSLLNWRSGLIKFGGEMEGDLFFRWSVSLLVRLCPTGLLAKFQLFFFLNVHSHDACRTHEATHPNQQRTLNKLGGWDSWNLMCHIM